jgi:hypothetical protein
MDVSEKKGVARLGEEELFQIGRNGVVQGWEVCTGIGQSRLPLSGTYEKCPGLAQYV